MTKVITYGTYDLLHEGHIRLLRRARELGDYLIVGVTTDDFDLARGKINVQQSLVDRMEAVRATGLADRIIVEEYEGQKIDDIHRYDVDIFTVGSDWRGHFDYLGEYCRVVYLDRTEGISSSQLRSTAHSLRIGIVGEGSIADKFFRESGYVNGVKVSGFFSENPDSVCVELSSLSYPSLDELAAANDALYIASHPARHEIQIEKALGLGLHVLCEAPVALSVSSYRRLNGLAKRKGLVLMEGIKTAYSLAFTRLMLLIKGGAIGDVVSVDSTCTSLMESVRSHTWNSISWWGPTALLPITTVFGSGFTDCRLVTRRMDGREDFDIFTQGTLVYPHGIATFKVGQGVKSEGELIISGTRGYAYVPAPWWKTDYFEIRHENPADNRRYFYQLDGEGIRNEIRSFLRLAEGLREHPRISEEQTETSIRMIEEAGRPDATVI